MFEVGAAIMQVGRAGSEDQIKAVGEILKDSRRRIYLVLAEGTHRPRPTGTPGHDRPATDTDA